MVTACGSMFWRFGPEMFWVVCGIWGLRWAFFVAVNGMSEGWRGLGWVLGLLIYVVGTKAEYGVWGRFGL